MQVALAAQAVRELSMQNHMRRGFTLVELLVVIAVVGILIALLLPAVQMAREAANRSHCQNNLKQIALALTNFSDSLGAYPPARIDERPGATDGQNCGGNHASWMVRVLPYLEQSSAHDQWQIDLPMTAQTDAARATIVPAYVCPSRRSVTAAVLPSQMGPDIYLPCGCAFPGKQIPGGAVSDYAGNHGDLSPGSSGLSTDLYWGGNGTGVLITSRGICDDDRPVNWRDRVRTADVLDGLSNTAIVGERHVQLDKMLQAPDDGPMYDGSAFYYMSRVGGPGVPLARGPRDSVDGMGLYAFGSVHPGVVQFAFCDGHVAAIPTTISTLTLERLCNRADGQPIPGY